MSVKTKRKKIMLKYYYGVGKLVSEETGYTQQYVLQVLNGLHEDRHTVAKYRIIEAAEKYKIAQ